MKMERGKRINGSSFRNICQTYEIQKSPARVIFNSLIALLLFSCVYRKVAPRDELYDIL